MKPTVSFCLVCATLLLSSCFYREYNPSTQEYQRRAYIPLIKGVKKKKRHLATYPPATLTSELANYHKRFNQFPKTLNDFYNGSIEGWNTIEQMLQTNYDDISIGYSSPDSLVIDYRYSALTKKEEEQSEQIVFSGNYNGQYIFTTADGGVLVENRLTKRSDKKR